MGGMAIPSGNWVRFSYLVFLKIAVKWFMVNLLSAILNWVRFDIFYFLTAKRREQTRSGIWLPKDVALL